LNDSTNADLNADPKSHLKFHRHLVEQIVMAVEEIFTQARYADKVIERFMKTQRKWGSRDRKFFAESVYEIVRWWRYLGALAGFDPSELQTFNHAAILRLWAAWCFETYGQIPDWDDFKDFDPAVLAKRKSEISSVAVRESVPEWLYAYGKQEIGEEWDDILKALNRPAEVFLRANTLKGTREELIKKLVIEEIEAVAVPGVDDGVKLVERANVFSTEAFKQGLFEVQDGASQMVAPMLQVEPGHRVIDACAGAGGKSLHLAALMKNKGKIVSMDIHDWKLDDLKERARRNRVDIIETRVIDSTKVIKRLEASADRLLLDVPCSGLGTLRRNPDKKWKVSVEEIQRLQVLQAELLANYSKMVKPEGMMVYATCSMMPSENEAQVRKFLETNGTQWTLIREMNLLPNRDGFDGFYGALLKRR
jgi:16S rRNA (cytosine967-C5)-methyltransferase